MPTILNEDLAYEWMFGKLDEQRILEIAATQYPAAEMQACAIAKDFRDALEPSKDFFYELLPLESEGKPSVPVAIQKSLF